MMKRIMLGLGLGLTAAAAAQAHVSAEPSEAPAGATQVVRFRVGHGCHETAATTALRIEMPTGLASARPQPKPGWALAVEHDATGAVKGVQWTGRLPGDQFDEFSILVKLPSDQASVAFPAVQTCGAEAERWTETQDPAQPGRKLGHPAPTVRLTPPAAPDGGHHH
jgi:periplasmic copper chaperone A